MISTSDSIMVLLLPQPRPTKTRTTTNLLNPHLLSRPLTLPLLATMTIKMMILMCMPVTGEDSDAVLPELAADCGVPGLRLEASGLETTAARCAPQHVLRCQLQRIPAVHRMHWSAVGVLLCC
jgi:hypothetical protein